jgi:two-component system cell cycle response regulator
VAAPDDTTGSLDNKTIAPGRSGEVTATLIVLTGRLPLGKAFLVGTGETVIGRSTGADIWVDDEGVSRQHAKLSAEKDVVTLLDLDSRNGTFCNGERVTRRALQDGDKIQIGSATVFRYSLQDSLDEAMQRNLYDSATHDGLTGIHNKRFFQESLEKEFAYCIRHRQPLALLMMDIDHFKQVNDTHGHPAGDHVLLQLAKKLTDATRTEDVLARFGGEEFVLLLRECPHTRALNIAERLRRTAEKLDLSFNHQGFHITMSVGVATLGENNFMAPDELVEAADKALYAAKQAGRNRVSG